MHWQKVTRGRRGFHSQKLDAELKKLERIATAICAACGSTDNVQMCIGCEAVHYCSTDCQEDDWQQHKAQCGAAN